MQKELITSVDALIMNSLKEDISAGLDITSESLAISNEYSVYELSAKENAVLFGVTIFQKVFEIIDPSIKINVFKSDGDKIINGEKILTIEGRPSFILKGERTALNFISHLSGVASLTSEMVELIKDTGCHLLDTRKTTPGYRDLEKKSVLAGGGKNHRFNLSDMILIKDNHIKEVGSVKEAVRRAKAYVISNSQSDPESAFEYSKLSNIPIEVEVENLDQLKEAIDEKPDVIMFDNWKPEDLKEAIQLVPKHIKTEASGLINKANIREFALTGVNYVSSSFMVKNAKWVDFSLNCV